MDLKQFATLQKIQGKSDLLRYVVAHDDVPMQELENAFGNLIENEKSPIVEALFDDYGAFLQKQTRLGVVPLANNTFEVSGDIDSNLIDTIELLSGDSREDIVNNLVFTIMSEIRGSHDLEISDIQLTETELDSAVNKVLNKAEEAIAFFKSNDLTHDVSNIDELEDSNEDELEDSNEDELEESNIDELEESNEDEFEDSNIDELEESNEDELEESNIDELEESSDSIGRAEKDLGTIDFDSLTDSVDFGNDVTQDADGHESDELVESEYDSDIEGEEPQQTAAEVVQKIYNKVIDDLKARDLDKRLDLAI